MWEKKNHYLYGSLNFKEIQLMKTINKDFSFTNATGGEHVQLHSDTLEKITEEFATTYGISAVRDAYATAYKAEQDYFLFDRAFEDTTLLSDADGKRDNGFNMVYYGVDVMAKYCLDPELQAIAQRLARLLRVYRGATRKTYAEETAILSDAYAKLSTEANLADLEKLHLAEALAAGKAANDEFRALYVNRSAEILRREESENMSELRPKTDAAFRDLAEAINALYAVNALIEKDPEKEEALGAMIDAVNALLAQLSRAMGERPSSSKDDNKTEEKPNETPGGTETPAPEDPGTETPDGEGTEPGGEQTTPTEPGDETEEPQPGVDTDGDGSPEVV